MPKTFSPKVAPRVVTPPVFQTWVVVYDDKGSLVEGLVICQVGKFIAACRKQLGVEILDTSWDRQQLS